MALLCLTATDHHVVASGGILPCGRRYLMFEYVPATTTDRKAVEQSPSAVTAAAVTTAAAGGGGGGSKKRKAAAAMQSCDTDEVSGSIWFALCRAEPPTEPYVCGFCFKADDPRAA